MNKAMEPQTTRRIFALRHPETGLTRFIESTYYLLPEKKHRILAVARHGDGSLRSRWIRTLQARGLEPVVVLLQEDASEGDLLKWKREYSEELLDNVTRNRPKHEHSTDPRTG